MRFGGSDVFGLDFWFGVISEFGYFRVSVVWVRCACSLLVGFGVTFWFCCLLGGGLFLTSR